MIKQEKYPGIAVLALVTLAFAAAPAQSTPVPISTTSPQNGVTEIYSVTFDGPVSTCVPTSPPYCPFFNNGFPPAAPPAVRALAISPNPTTVSTGVPDGITPVPAAGSYLDLTLGAGNTSLTLAGGTIKFPNLDIVIRDTTFVATSGAGIVFKMPPQTVPVDANGVAEFLVSTGTSVAVDFSTFTDVIDNCAGPLCTIIPILTLDMVRFRLVIDYDATFDNFTASYIGQTSNNSFLFTTLNSASLIVSDSEDPADDGQVPFGQVPVGQTQTRTVTVRNWRTTPVSVQVGLTEPLEPPFSLVNDLCSSQSLGADESCTFEIEFQPTDESPVSHDLDVVSVNPDSPAEKLTVSGTGTSLLVPNIVVTDNVDAADDLTVSFPTVLVSTVAEQTITIGNDGAASLDIGTLGAGDALGAPFSFAVDNCSNQTILPGGTCTVTIAFAPDAILAYGEKFDIPSNDPDQPDVLFTLSGEGGGTLTLPSASGADSGFMALDPLTLLGLGLFGLAPRRKLRAGQR